MLLLGAATFAGATRGIPADTSVFADGMGKWLQIRGLLVRGDFKCVYHEDFDPDFRFIPGPWYFYAIKDGACTYGYQAAYALLAAPFFRIHPAGFLFLHLLLYLGYIAGFMAAAEKLLPGRAWVPWGAGLSAGWIIPSLVFGMDLAEVLLSLTMGVGALALISSREDFKFEGIRNLLSKENLQIRAKPVFAGVILGLVLSLRTESLIHALVWIAALFFFQRKNVISFTGGYALGAGIVVAFHLWFFGNAMGNRGSSHAALAAGLDWKAHLDIAKILLLGGPLGLLTSLPVILLGALAFLPWTRREHGVLCAFLAVISILPTIGVLATAPSDGGYSWGPRFLSLTFAPYLMLVVISLDHPSFRKWPATAAILLVAAYGISYTWKGRNVYRHAFLQNAGYTQYINSEKPQAIVVAHHSFLGAVSRSLAEGRVYQANDPESARDLAKGLAGAGLNRVILMRYANSPVQELPGWRITSKRMMDLIEFVTFER